MPIETNSILAEVLKHRSDTRCEIVRDPNNLGWHGSNGEVGISLLAQDGRMLKERAIKNVGTPQARLVEGLYVELGDVRVYVRGKNVIVTRERLRP